MVAPQIKDTTQIAKALDAAKNGTTDPSNKTDTKASTSSSSVATGATSSNEQLTSAQASIKLQSQQSDTVYNDILTYLDWDNTHKEEPEPFQPFFFFASQDLQKANPDLQTLVKNLKALPASRLVGDKGKETGQAWEFGNANLAGTLEAGMGTRKPALYLGYDMVTIDGKLRPCRVANQWSAA